MSCMLHAYLLFTCLWLAPRTNCNISINRERNGCSLVLSPFDSLVKGVIMITINMCPVLTLATGVIGRDDSPLGMTLQSDTGIKI